MNDFRIHVLCWVCYRSEKLSQEDLSQQQYQQRRAEKSSAASINDGSKSSKKKNKKKKKRSANSKESTQNDASASTDSKVKQSTTGSVSLDKNETIDNGQTSGDAAVKSGGGRKRKRKQKKTQSKASGDVGKKSSNVALSDDRLKAYGLNPRDVKYTLKERQKAAAGKS